MTYVGWLLAGPVLAGLAFFAPAQDTRPDPRKELGRLWAEQRYAELLNLAEPHLGEAKDSADLWIMAAEAALKLEDYPRAIAAFERGLALAPALRAATINLGFAYLRVDRVADARKVFDFFVRDPSRDRAAKAQYGLGLALLAEGDSAGARKAFATSIVLDAEDARPHYRLGLIALQAGDFAVAIEAFETAIRYDELHYGAAFGLARAHAAAGHDAEAARWSERHRKILETGDAVANMIRALGRAPDPVMARVAIGARLEEAGARDEARAWFERALRIDPANEEARRRLKNAGDTRAESRR